MFSSGFVVVFNIFLYIIAPIFLYFGFRDTKKHWHDADDISFEEDFK